MAEVVGDKVMYSSQLDAAIRETDQYLAHMVATVGAAPVSLDASAILAALVGEAVHLVRINECLELLCVQGAKP